MIAPACPVGSIIFPEIYAWVTATSLRWHADAVYPSAPALPQEMIALLKVIICYQSCRQWPSPDAAREIPAGRKITFSVTPCHE
jgi:hypothetical protein